MPPLPAEQSADQVYLTARQVVHRYGRKSLVWLWRLLRRDAQFPRPLEIGGQRYWPLADLEAYERARRQAA
jgi:predicted DNA-binding transcriptional regulator AlpA